MSNQVITKDQLVTVEEAENMLDVCSTGLRDLAKKLKLAKVKDKLNKRNTYYLKSQVEEVANNRFYIVNE